MASSPPYWEKSMSEPVTAAKCGALLDALRVKKPLVHFITNYVTVNDCANITLAVGGAPVMSDQPDDAAEICRLASALVFNIGTPGDRTLEAMLRAGKAANEAGIPVVLDPVGAGASSFRNRLLEKLLEEVKFAAVKGNISEIRFLASGTGKSMGVDASKDDIALGSDSSAVARLAAGLSRGIGAVVIVSGRIDVAADGERAYGISNGDAMMGRLTGTGCMGSGVVASFLGAAPSEPLASSIAGMCVMGLAGELARKKLAPSSGTGTYRTILMDEVSCMTGSVLENGVRLSQIVL